MGLSLWTLQETRRRTLAYVDGISQQALDHNPPGQRHSVATLLYHIAVFEVDWLYVDILGGDYDMDHRIPNCPPKIAAYLPYPLIMEDRSYTPVEGELLGTHLERLSVIREAFLEVMGGMSLTDFRTLRPSDDEMVSPEWVVEHLSQHEAEHRGQIWEARVAAEAKAEAGD
ncbi:MAG: DinB family protein [Acidobacteria bacterium]|nr:MAG: DinB family protein [Acidobacteriota bacterium]